MSHDNVFALKNPAVASEVRDALTEVLREGARTLLAQAIEAEVAEFLAAHADQRDMVGRARLVGMATFPSARCRLASARSEACPQLAFGDGALGFWKALPQVFGSTREQRCWVHKTANVLNKLPKHLQPKAKSDLHQIWMGATRDDAHRAFATFVQTYEPKYPKAAEC